MARHGRLQTALAAAALMAGAHSAAKADSTGHGALALAVIVGEISPVLNPYTKPELIRLLNDKNLPHRKQGKIIVTATSITCRAGDVDIAAFSCALSFGPKMVSLSGRHANELFATLAEAGEHSDGAAGTIFEAVHMLKCTIDPAVIAQKSGGGADCSFLDGPS